MFLVTFIRVYENLNDDQSSPDKLPFVMETNDTNPGFTKLKSVDKSCLDIDMISDWCETVGEQKLQSVNSHWMALLASALSCFSYKTACYRPRAIYSAFKRCGNDELIPLIDGETCFIPPVVFSYLLQFLCCYQLGDYIGTHNALQDLELTIREQDFIFSSDLINTSFALIFLYVASMNLNDRNLSLQFYNYLCDIIGSEDVIKKRREMFTAYDFFQRLKSSTFISSGSKSEGIDLKGSDYDRMICFNLIRVHESLTDIQSAPHEIILLMETNATKPGFTKLKLVHKSDLHLINDFCKTVGEDIFISSNLVRERNCRNGWIIHGPCLSNPDGDYDLAMCFRCKEWITPAQQWIHRSHELKPLITDDSLPFPPVVYSYLLQFLCCYHLGDYIGKLNALHDLELTIRERYFVFANDDILLIVNKSLAMVKSLI
ncbi:unnamed protein product [Mytilus coruscus]|uniref:Uncharacterized protein n=1 Tax=Mytilus coruscus TaxID=42192 RepID=A0A6J8EID5_MYTCO|nr:unnamed protein product [Mytilus coruscus]